LGAHVAKSMVLSWTRTPWYQMVIVVGSLQAACYKSHDKHKPIVHLFLHHFLFHQNLLGLYMKNQLAIIIVYVIVVIFIML
jgi:hypothetical protein